MVKNIIKRIIVGVGIALALMYIKGGLIADTYALSSNVNPSSGCVVPTVQDTTCSSFNILNFSIGDTHYFGNRFSNEATRARVVWSFNTPSNLRNKYYDIDFIIFLSGKTTYLESNRGYIINSSDNLFSCEIDNTRYGNFGSSSVNDANGTATVHCNNVYITDTFNFYLLDFTTIPSGVVGVSPFTLTENSTTAIQEEIENVNNSIQQTNDNLTSEESADTEGFLGDLTPDYSNNPVSDLITMPITFLQSLNNNASGSCVGWDLGNLLGTNLTMPCINLQNILGSRLYNLIDMAICLFLAYNLGLMCVTIWNNITGLKDDFDNMYSPKGYPMDQIRSDD